MVGASLGKACRLIMIDPQPQKKYSTRGPWHHRAIILQSQNDVCVRFQVRVALLKVSKDGLRFELFQARV